ncbi:hypothetical protein R6258_15750 [Halomonas sp. HP20-15]|uniref:hypothetical protein n=1 Tax=Halomonas sp. HP20-15 TaxID=3085901 RepID=UPI0029824C0F|nr:hypothetical protein [Halomonas sp. HP20-15]MDW5378379.1 hypothetical protein [Halomonas sp. HP20-15]
MTHTARVEPITQEQEDATMLAGWRVVDVTDPDAPVEISRHDTEPEAIQAARDFERQTAYETGSAPDDNQDYDAGETPTR